MFISKIFQFSTNFNYNVKDWCLVYSIEIIDIECGLLSHVSQKIGPQNGGFITAKLTHLRSFCAKANGSFEENRKWPIYTGKYFRQIGPLSCDSTDSISDNYMVYRQHSHKLIYIYMKIGAILFEISWRQSNKLVYKNITSWGR